MRLDYLKHCLSLFGLAAAVLAWGAVVQAQEDGPPPSGHHEHYRDRGYWIGLKVVTEGERDNADGDLMVMDVVPDGPAAKAGIQKGDVLMKAGDKPLKRLRDLVDVIEDFDGKPVSITLK